MVPVSDNPQACREREQTAARADLTLCAAVTLALFTVWIYGHYLNRDCFIASGDFPAGVSYALNYKLAVENGQWLPRWVIIAREVSLRLGSIDGTPPTADAPDFQYYGFLQSALAYPFLCKGLSAIKALQLIVILAFVLAGLALFAAGRLWGAQPLPALLGGCSYVLSPWLVSNFYGRGGIAEALGQAALTLPLLGFALVFTGRPRSGLLTVALGVFVLALSHPVFLLYGVFLCLLLALFSIRWRALWETSFRPAGWRPALREPSILVCGVLLGMAASAWQWMPALLTVKEINVLQLGLRWPDGRSAIPSANADLSGARGFPKQFVEPGTCKPREFFWTIGWWTLPSILGLCLCRRRLRQPAAAIFWTFTFFFLMTYWPAKVYPYLPASFGAIQFIFRLLAFLSVLGALALPLALPNLNRWVVLGTIVVMTYTQWQVLFFPMPEQQFPDDQYLKGYEYSAFYKESPRGFMVRLAQGLLNKANLLHLAQPGASEVHLRVQGRTVDPRSGTRLFVAPASDPAHPVSDCIGVAAGEFDVTLSIREPRNYLRLYTTDPVPPLVNSFPVSIHQLHLIYGPVQSFVPATEVIRAEAEGYRRVFRIPAGARQNHAPRQPLVYTIELPMVYSRFAVPCQNGKRLPAEVDFNHRLSVQTTDLDHEITVKYQLPAEVWLLTLIGVIGFVFVAALGIAHRVRFPPESGPAH
jgi:hypothetical protein